MRALAPEVFALVLGADLLPFKIQTASRAFPSSFARRFLGGAHFASGQFLQYANRTANILLAIPLGHRSLIKLLCQTGKHQRDTNLRTEVDRKADILLQPLDREIGREIALED